MVVFTFQFFFFDRFFDSDLTHDTRSNAFATSLANTHVLGAEFLSRVYIALHVWNTRYSVKVCLILIIRRWAVKLCSSKESIRVLIYYLPLLRLKISTDLCYLQHRTISNLYHRVLTIVWLEVIAFCFLEIISYTAY